MGFRENMLALYPKKAALEFGRRAKENLKNDDDDDDEKPKKKINDNSLERQIHEKMAFIKYDILSSNFFITIFFSC